MVKHPACAAAISSSGFVPFSFSKRVLKEYGVAASTPESVERLPLPSRPVPLHTAFALRIMLHLLAVVTSYSCPTWPILVCREALQGSHAGIPRVTPVPR